VYCQTQCFNFLLTTVSLGTTRFHIKKNSTWCSLCVACFVRNSEKSSSLCFIHH